MVVQTDEITIRVRGGAVKEWLWRVESEIRKKRENEQMSLRLTEILRG